MRLTLTKSMTFFLRVRHRSQIQLSFLFSIVLGLVISSAAYAYPDFIAYGYRSCLTCHFNGDGGGALNDYGRAVWASEFTSKAIFNRHTSDDKMGENSGFLGPVQLPWWIRPGIKTRDLYMVTNPGSKKQNERSIDMQREVNVAIFFDKDQRLMFYGDYGYRPLPQQYIGVSGKKPSKWISRNAYMRWQYNEKLFLYAGTMDKVFGIKNVDHTAYGRVYTRTTMDDQTDGVKAHYIADQYEIFGQIFAGNLAQTENLREKGFSFKYEKALKEKVAWGLSVMSTKNDYVEKQMASTEFRMGLRNPGDGLIGEIGFINSSAKGSKAELGYYTLLENMTKLVRGYNLLATFENYKEDTSKNGTENYRYGVGLLAFPWIRTELRLQLLNYRTLVPGQANPDSWVAMGQIHLSL